MRKQAKSDLPSFNEKLWEEVWDLLLLPDEQALNAACVPGEDEDTPDRLTEPPD